MRREQEPQRFEKSREPSNELEELYRSWGVFDLLGTTIDLLPPDWLRILNIARNLLDGKPIPGVNVSNALKALTERNVKLDYEKRLVTQKWQEPIEIPSDNIEVKPIKDLTELPRVLPPHLLLVNIAPDLFTYKAISGSLPVSENQQPKVIMEEKSETVDELKEITRVGRSMRQKVYVLFDMSGSMAENHKLTFAKAIVMAYLAKAYEEDAQLYFLAFDEYTRARIDCVNSDKFPPLSEYVLSILPPTIGRLKSLFLRVLFLGSPMVSINTKSVGTDIGRALETAMEDVSKIDQLKPDRPATTEILLITDGASHTAIPFIPQSITLHTLHLQGGREVEHDPWLTQQEYEERVSALRGRSKTYTIIDTSVLRPPPLEEDLKLLDEEAKRLKQELKTKDSKASQNDNDLRNRIEKARKMTMTYRKMYPKDRDLRRTEKKIERARNGTEPGGIQKMIQQALDTAREKMKRQTSHPKQNAPRRRRRQIRMPSRKTSSGTLFDFRIKQDK
jgi:hypothetical protein